jgi:hypothetical protein
MAPVLLCATTVAENGSVPNKKHSSKFFKNEEHWVRVTFDQCTGLGHCWAIPPAAFFLMGGYFIIQVVFFRPWGLQNTKNAFYKKMLCDQASSSHYQPPASSQDLPDSRR